MNIVVCVDDLLLLSAMKVVKKPALKDLRSSVPINNLAEVSCYLGRQITRNRKARMVSFDQGRHTQIVAKRFDVRKTSASLPSYRGRHRSPRPMDRSRKLSFWRCATYHTERRWGPRYGSAACRGPTCSSPPTPSPRKTTTQGPRSGKQLRG